jgi:uncharacterized membrane protein YczE
MLPFPSARELLRRVPRVVFGLVLFGVGISMMILADLGLSPWEALHQGISYQTGIPIGTVGIITGMLVLILWVPLGEKLGLGTIMNVFLIGIVIDLTIWLAPESIDETWLQWGLLVGGVLLVGVGSGLYIGGGLGPGPRDGLMTGLARRDIPIGLARGGVEISVLVFGWLLGGTIGIGTVLFAFGIGPLIGLLLPLMSLDPLYDYGQPADGPGATEGAL